MPTRDETLRIKAYLIVRRNHVRDYLAVAALSARYGPGDSARHLAQIDRYYTDLGKEGTPVAAQLVRQLADPRPKDNRTVNQLSRYKAPRSIEAISPTGVASRKPCARSRTARPRRISSKRWT